MPGLDGLDTMRIVRQLDGYRELPIIAVTAKAMVGDREKCIEAGATDYIAKPVNVDVLLATLWRALQATHDVNREFDSLLETLAGLAAANIVLVETLHEHGVVDKTHFAHAFARALDTLAPEHRGGMIEHVLRNMRDRCMNLPAGEPSDAQEWIWQFLS